MSSVVANAFVIAAHGLTVFLPACSPPQSAPKSPTQSVSPSKTAAAEPVFHYSALDNGDFNEAGVTDANGVQLIPWWKLSLHGQATLERKGTTTWMRTAPGASIEQPIPAYAPLIGSLVLRCRMQPDATWTLTDGKQSTVETVTAQSSVDDRVVVKLARASGVGSGNPGSSPLPRLTLSLRGAWQSIEATVDLPCPSETALRAELITEIDEIFRTWFERGIDDVGPKHSGFLAKYFDAVTGEQLSVARSTGFNPMYQALFDALGAEELPAWRATFERFLTDFFVLQLDPRTGLPCNYDPVTDLPDETTPVEIAQPLSFLIDVAQRGPEKFRARAKDAATKIGNTVLLKGLIPDGTCAASYVPRDGTPNVDVGTLRRLNVPVQLVRLSVLTGDARYAKAAREPLSTLEFTNLWTGTWEQIDPGFDDTFGNFGGSAARVAREAPDEVTYRRFALEGWNHFEPIWRDALRLGGNVAADQVRCWKVGIDIAHFDPDVRARLGPLLRMAARSHFKGEQWGNGSWGDVTVFGFSPMLLQTGDLTGSPQNLLSGLASIYTDDLGLRTDEIRAMYTTVLRSSIAQYKRPYGFLIERSEHKGANPAVGSLRMLTGMVEMLRALTPPK